MRLLTLDITTGARDPAVRHLLTDLAEAHAAYERAYGNVTDGTATVLGLSADAAATAPALPASSCVYAVCVTGASDPAVARVALDSLARRCEAMDLRWMGGLAIADAPVVALMAGSPRMGWRRRRVSEAVDRLVAAIRSGAAAGTSLIRPSHYARLRALLGRHDGTSGPHEAV